MLFFVSQLSQNIIKNEEINHFKTMRVKIGQIVDATDLNGTRAKIKIIEINPKYSELKFDVLEKKTYSQNVFSKNTVILNSFQDPPALENELTIKPNQKILFQAITDKVYLEKLCEIAPLAGITTINLFFSDRSIKQNVQIERLNKILIRACEQSETLFLPKLILLDKKGLAKQILESKPAVLACYLDKEETKIKTIEVTPVSPFENSINVDAKKSSQREVAAKLTEGVHSTLETQTQSEQNQNNSCLVGPEGGWNERELIEFRNLDLEFVSLGTTIFPAWLAGFRYFATN